MRILLIPIIGIIVLQACNGKASEKKSKINPDTIPVKLLPINQDTGSNTINASGLLSTENEARLSFKISGIIEKIFVKEGDRIRKGQLLATLKSAEIAAQVQQVQLAVEKAQRDYQRANNLYKDSVATLEQLQNAKTGVDLARQSLQQAAFNQQYSKIYAPADGFVTKKVGNEGELANSGSPVLFVNAISASSKWILKIGLSDKEWAAIAVGNKAAVTVDAFPGQLFNGIVSKKSISADAASGSFQVEVQVDFGKQQPAIGMFGTASLKPSRSSVGFSIPYEALLEANGKKGFVFISDNKKTVKKCAVTITSISNDVVYIEDGLQGHAFVVTSGSPYLNDNSIIIPIQ
ncbi:MAG TPA: efflux RND transporter periplasmic adaptor subunit [Chitinophagaceae bacterium]|jgi:RND family efflux transporter MFP subunit|nr:efflux RND transporter periplasmic adaptor subunit [Chitinophagaceae bacterium]